METGNTDDAVFVLDPGSDLLADTDLYRQMQSPAERLRALAGAVAASPGFRDLEGAVLVVRAEEPMRLGLLGRFSAVQSARIAALPAIIESGLRRLRYVTYQEAEGAARVLAEKLAAYLGPDGLSRCRLVALPRGGLFVLGQLAYLLDLRPDQLIASPAAPGNEHSPETPLIVVDDCALSGLRFAETLAGLEAPAVVFAHLFSHPALRESIEQREARVAACLAGEDLTDMSEEILGDDKRAWTARWRSRSEGEPFWLGLPEHVCFPWNEPDVTVWNPETGAEEAPWRVVPAEYCIKNAPLTRTTGLIQEQPVSRGSTRLADATLFATLGDEILVASAETGQAYSFQGVAAAMWAALMSEESPKAALEKLDSEYDVDPGQLRSDLDSLLERCVELGLLCRAADGETSG